MITLSEGFRLQSGKYEIIKILGQGGFGITYLARHTILDTLFAIKEFFPADYCNRDSTTSRVDVATQSNVELVNRLKARFVSEARNMIQLKNPGIVGIHDIFEENSTAYFVMDYIKGQSLEDIVSMNGPMQERKAVECIKRVTESVKYIHNHHITHFDIKPANIMVRESDGVPVLIDFGLSKQYTEQGNARSTLLMGVSHGYSPLEQYMQDGIDSFSPKSDLYALGATLYFLVTGRVPPESLKLTSNTIEVPETVSPSTANTIKWAMQSDLGKRCPSADDFIRSLDSKETRTTLSSTYNKPYISTSGSPKTSLSIKPEVVNSPRVNNKPASRPVTAQPYTTPKRTSATTIVLIVAGLIIGILVTWIIVGKSSDAGDMAQVSEESGAQPVSENSYNNNEVSEISYNKEEQVNDVSDNSHQNDITNYIESTGIESTRSGKPTWYYEGAFSDGKKDYAIKLAIVKNKPGEFEAVYKNVAYDVAPMQMSVVEIASNYMELYSSKYKLRIILYTGTNGSLTGRAEQGKNDLSVHLVPTRSGF